MVRKQRIIPAGEFKARCLGLLDEVELHGEEIVVTKRGRPVARLVPLDDEPPRLRRRNLSHLVTFVGDVVSPIDIEWDAMK